MKTATKIVKSIFRRQNRQKVNFKQISWVREKILKHQEDLQVKKFAFERFKVGYKKPYELLHTYKEIFEKEIYRFSADKPDPLIIDCGANIGLSVIYYKMLFPKAKVFAFEPDENNFQLLKENIQLNQFDDVVLHQEAVWTSNGKISFLSNESEASHISTDLTTGSLVKTIRLKDFLEKFDEVDFLKMDIEGAEWEVIKDCASSLFRIKNLFLEYHGKVNETDKLLDLLQIVKNTGFNVYFKTAADQMKHPFVEKSLDLPYDVQLNIFCYR